MSEHRAEGIEPFSDGDPGGCGHFQGMPRYGAGEAEVILNRLQRNGSALAACECGSRSWLPPEGIYQITAAGASQRIPLKSVIPVTCAACGFTKFYDPAVVASLAESSGRW